MTLIPVLQMMELKHIETKSFAQGHAATMWWSLNSNADNIA